MWDMTIAHRGLKFIIISRGQRLGLGWQCSRSDVEPRSRAVFSSLMPNSHRPPDTTRQCSLCRVRWCELSRSDRLTGAFCVAVRPAVAPVVLAPPPPRHTPTLNSLVGRLGRLNSHRHTRNNKMVLSVSCLVWRCELDDSSERVHTSKFLSVTVMSCRESSSHRRRGRVTDKTVSGVAV